MKTPKPAVDNTAAYMNKGLKENPKQNAPKGASFNETLTSQAPHVNLGKAQHEKPMNKHGNRHGGPLEHLDPSSSIFHKL